MVPSPGKWLAAALVAAMAALALSPALPAGTVRAQVFGPPMTVFGSVTDSAGDVPADLPIEALIGGTVCGRGKTQYTGEGDARVTVYFADVVSREQTSGCGADGVEVRIRVGDRLATQTLPWRPGPAQMHITFGDATPRAIPTFTPTPRPGASATATAEPPTRTPTPRPPDPGSPAASPSPSPSPSPSLSPTNTTTATATPTLAGGLLTTRPAGPGADSGDDGFPVWAFAVIAFGALAAIGGGIGYALARSRDDDDELPPAG